MFAKYWWILVVGILVIWFWPQIKAWFAKMSAARRAAATPTPTATPRRIDWKTIIVAILVVALLFHLYQNNWYGFFDCNRKSNVAATKNSENADGKIVINNTAIANANAGKNESTNNTGKKTTTTTKTVAAAKATASAKIVTETKTGTGKITIPDPVNDPNPIDIPDPEVPEIIDECENFETLSLIEVLLHPIDWYGWHRLDHGPFVTVDIDKAESYDQMEGSIVAKTLMKGQIFTADCYYVQEEISGFKSQFGKVLIHIQAQKDYTNIEVKGVNGEWSIYPAPCSPKSGLVEDRVTYNQAIAVHRVVIENDAKEKGKPEAYRKLAIQFHELTAK